MSQVEVVVANPFWTNEYLEIARNLRDTIGDAAVRIDHIGSTSVTDLAAKDVIDIQISVVSLTTQMVTSSLKNIGYREVPNLTDNLVGVSKDSPELQKKFLNEPERHRRTNVHVREIGRLNQTYPLIFRDFLRDDEATRMAYQTIKLELAKRFPNDIDAYYAIKDPYMDTVYRAALAWAKTNDWQADHDFQ